MATSFSFVILTVVILIILPEVTHAAATTAIPPPYPSPTSPYLHPEDILPYLWMCGVCRAPIRFAAPSLSPAPGTCRCSSPTYMRVPAEDDANSRCIDPQLLYKNGPDMVPPAGWQHQGADGGAAGTTLNQPLLGNVSAGRPMDPFTWNLMENEYDQARSGLPLRLVEESLHGHYQPGYGRSETQVQIPFLQNTPTLQQTPQAPAINTQLLSEDQWRPPIPVTPQTVAHTQQHAIRLRPQSQPDSLPPIPFSIQPQPQEPTPSATPNTPAAPFSSPQYRHAQLSTASSRYSEAEAETDLDLDLDAEGDSDPELDAEGDEDIDLDNPEAPAVAPSVPPMASSPSELRCDKCPYTSYRKCDMKRHQKKHLKPDERQHHCSKCNYAANDKKDLKRHYKSKHSQSRDLKCPDLECELHDKGMSRRDNLNRHIRKRHPQLAVQMGLTGPDDATPAPTNTTTTTGRIGKGRTGGHKRGGWSI